MPVLKRSFGFTIIELMLVSAIIGLLASIAIPKFANLIDKSRESTLKGSLGSLRSALEIYYVDNEGIYPKCGAVGFGPFWGVWHLNGKYIDMNRINFVLPRYAQKLCVGYPDAVSAESLYSPPPGMGFVFNIWIHAPAPPHARPFCEPIFFILRMVPGFLGPRNISPLGNSGGVPRRKLN